ncbi:DUF2799 domain-containing protein [Parvularcula sp. ZS-1/3]|uniref:DUF2799 domain-containing protein n=1 Tax=Parvularcula mediterranea TaxID=2732508 RepID=A0A7Y3RKC7_9PROT|nr:DUF2799 domain-containing protein [Parvularcula mediterranea]NNU15270.1 DUF2799 domain-containing protein [Parvularcula mediterranea]
MARFAFPLVLGAILLASCATLSEGECQYSDWELVGEQDGINGAPLSKFQSYVKQCARYDLAVNSEAWRRGHQKGLETFCTPAGVYNAGLKGQGDAALCGFEPDLLRIHRAAVRFRQADQRFDEARFEFDNLFERRRFVRREIDRLRYALRKKDLSREQRARINRDLDEAFASLDHLERREYQLRFLLVDYERAAGIAEDELRQIEFEFGLR